MFIENSHEYIMKLNETMINKKQSVVLQHMKNHALIRSNIPNANNGRAYMSCLILDKQYRLLRNWLQ